MVLHRTVLVVDGNDIDRYQKCLLADPAIVDRVLTADSIDDGLAICSVEQPDGILLDLKPSSPNDLDFLTRLKQQLGEACPPVVVISTYNDATTATRAFKLGAEDYLVKDQVTTEEIRIALRSSIENAQLRQQLKQSEARYRAVVEDQTELICRFLPDCTLTFVNQAYCRYFGMSAEALIGKNFLELIGEPDRAVVQAQIARISQMTSENPVIVQEHTVIRPDGTVGWQQWTDRAIFDENHQLVELQSVGRDITEQKRAEALLRESNTKLQAVLDNSPAVIYVKDLQFRHILINRQFEAVFGLPREQLLNKTNAELLSPEEAIAITANDQALLESGGSIEVEESVLIEGEWHTFLSVKTVLKDSEGVVYGICGVSTDISDRKRLEQEREILLIEARQAREAAEEANQSKDNFLAIVSHELRAPLNSVLGWARLLQTRSLDEDAVTQALQVIERNAQSQSRLIEDLLDISRMVRGNLTLDHNPVNLAMVITTSIDVVRLSAEAKEIQLNSVIHHDSIFISGDSNRLQQIVWNLLTNAIKFTPKGGRVDIFLDQIGSEARIQVRDNGQGIEPEFLPYMFEQFQQGRLTTSKSRQGLGLGLAIVHHLVELHQGTISAESLGINQGATFTVRFPLLDQPSVTLLSEASAIRVLLVDDQEDSLSFLSLALEQEGMIVMTATSAQAAFDLLNEFQPNVLISDISMPDEDGYRFLQRVRAVEAFQGLIAIALTVSVTEEDQRQAFAAGYQLHLPKPVDIEQLVDAVFALVKAE
ncbi:hybrid sensor histidine kinase/response regulator [Leptolyngbya sp. AN03gr2]|uniref:hybrid sensor histidine kinase/response regulator n=1 Tax=unclassified Leptolyngbya TaxID=2650499 RepID=UPI003D31B407